MKCSEPLVLLGSSSGNLVKRKEKDLLIFTAASGSDACVCSRSLRDNGKMQVSLRGSVVMSRREAAARSGDKLAQRRETATS